MDGETCEIIEETDKYFLLQEITEQIPFKLSKEEFNIAGTCFVMSIQLEDKLPDSMCFDSGTHICHYENGNNTIDIDVRGYVTVDFCGERYKHYSDMPKELQKLFNSGKAYEDERVVINENNWYEIFFNYDEDYDIAEIENYTEKELKDYCEECLILFKTSNKS